MALDPNRWTQKTQEAFSRAVEAAKAESNPEVTPDHLLAALLRQEEGIVLPILQRLGLAPLAVRNAADDAVAKLPKAYGGEARLSRELQQVARRRRRGARRAQRRVPLHRAPPARAGRPARRRAASSCSPRMQEVRGSHRVTSPEPRGAVPGPREVRPRPHRGGPGREDRPGHRPRRGDPPRHPGAVPPHQEQPGAHRRARRRQDRDRRGPGPPHRRGRRAREPEAQAAHQPRPRFDGRRRQVPRRVRGAAQGRAQGDHRRRGRGHHLHRRAPHRRRRRRGRGRRWTPATCSSRCSPAASCA